MQWKATDQSFLHFTEDCFEVDSALAAQFRMKNRRRLKPDAIPTIFLRPSMSDAHVSEAKESSSSRRKRSTGGDGGSGMNSKKRRGAGRQEVSCNKQVSVWG